MNIRSHAAAAALYLAVLDGCAVNGQVPPTNQSQGVRPASPEQVKDCRYLDDIVGTSGWYGVYADKGMSEARSDVYRAAQARGATHIVWSPATVTYGSTAAAGKAYRCE